MKRIFLRVFSLLLAFGLCMMLPFYVWATDIEIEKIEIVDELQEKVDAISELVRLIRKAKMNHDMESVSAYIDMLARLGAHHVESEDIVQYLEMDGISLFEEEYVTNNGLPSVSDTANVDWYVADYERYYYPKDLQYYDVYMIIASPKNNQSMLHMEQRTLSNNAFAATWSNINDIIYEGALSFVAEKMGVDTVLTIFDVASALVSGITPQTVEEISAGAWTVHSICDSTFAYIYIRNAGSSQDYALAMMGSEVELEYAYMQNITVDLGNGHTESGIRTFQDSGLVYSLSTYRDIWSAIDAFNAGRYIFNHIGYIDVELFRINGVSGDTARIPAPNWVSNPNNIYGGNASGGDYE